MAIPIDRVLGMKEKGMENNEIVRNLQREGYSASDIFNALSQAEIKTGAAQPAAQEQEPEPPMPSEEEGYAEDYGAPPMPGGPIEPEYEGYAGYGGVEAAPAAVSEDSRIKERIEEIAEVIIEEKWSELVKDVNKILEWKEKTEARITQLDQQLKDLKISFSSLHESILAKISDYDQSITDVGAELKAMEKVFQKILPTLTQNVNELSRITADLKGKK